MYQEFDAQTIPYMYLPVLPLDPLPALSSTPKAKCNVQQVRQSADFIPSDRTTASSIKVLAGEFDALSGPPLTLHSDITGAKMIFHSHSLLL